MTHCYISSGIVFKGFGSPIKDNKVKYLQKHYYNAITLSDKARQIIEKISDTAMATIVSFDDMIFQHDIINFMIWFTNSFNLNYILNQLVSSVDKFNGTDTLTHNNNINTYCAKDKLKIAKAIIAKPILTGLIK